MLVIIPKLVNSLITGITLFCSSKVVIREAPGLVDSPPTSIKSAPFCIKSCAYLTAALVSLNNPPSEKESGVTFKTPTTKHLFSFANVGERPAGWRREP